MIYLGALVMTLLGSMGAFFFKRSAAAGIDVIGLLKNRWLYIGGICYVFGALMNVWLLRYMEYSILYPATAITYIWTLIISWRFLGEKVTKRKLAGVLMICLGVMILTR